MLQNNFQTWPVLICCFKDILKSIYKNYPFMSGLKATHELPARCTTLSGVYGRVSNYKNNNHLEGT